MYLKIKYYETYDTEGFLLSARLACDMEKINEFREYPAVYQSYIVGYYIPRVCETALIGTLKFDFDISDEQLKQVNQKCRLFEEKTADELLSVIHNYIVNIYKKELKQLRNLSFTLKKLSFLNQPLPKDISHIILGLACENEKILPSEIKQKLR